MLFLRMTMTGRDYKYVYEGQALSTRDSVALLCAYTWNKPVRFVWRRLRNCRGDGRHSRTVRPPATAVTWSFQTRSATPADNGRGRRRPWIRRDTTTRTRTMTTYTGRPAAADGAGGGTSGPLTMSTVRATAAVRTGREPGRAPGNGPRPCRGTVRRRTAVVPGAGPTTPTTCATCRHRRRLQRRHDGGSGDADDCCSCDDGDGGFGPCGFYSSRLLHLDPAVRVSWCRHYRHCQDICNKNQRLVYGLLRFWVYRR